MILNCLGQDTVINSNDSELPGSTVILSCLGQDTVVNYSDSELPGSGYGSKLQ